MSEAISDPKNNCLKFTQDFFVESLKRGNWNPIQVEEDFYVMSLKSKVGLLVIYAEFVPKLCQIVFSAFYPKEVPIEKISKVLEYINYINYGSRVGNFELQETGNEVYFRTSLLFYKIELTAQLINNLINNCVNYLEKYGPGISYVIEENLTPEEAYKKLQEQF